MPSPGRKCWGAQDVFIGVNALDYSVSGDTRVWIRRPAGTTHGHQEACGLSPDHYETIALDPSTLGMTGGHHWQISASGQRQTVLSGSSRARQAHTVTEDHSLFTIDPGTARLTTIKGAELTIGTPLAVPFDLSEVAEAWSAEKLAHLDITDCPLQSVTSMDIGRRCCWTGMLQTASSEPSFRALSDDRRASVYSRALVGGGGKSMDSTSDSLSFSVGGIPGAVKALRTFFGRFGVRLMKVSRQSIRLLGQARLSLPTSLRMSDSSNYPIVVLLSGDFIRRTPNRPKKVAKSFTAPGIPPTENDKESLVRIHGLAVPPPTRARL